MKEEKTKGTFFPEIAGPLEKALARLGLAWGWESNYAVIIDTLPVGRAPFPASVRMGPEMIELRTEVWDDPSEEEVSSVVHGESESMSPAFPLYPLTPGGRDMGLAVRILLPEEPRAKDLVPLLREGLRSLSDRRDEVLGKNKKEEDRKADSSIEKDDA